MGTKIRCRSLIARFTNSTGWQAALNILAVKQRVMGTLNNANLKIITKKSRWLAKMTKIWPESPTWSSNYRGLSTKRRWCIKLRSVCMNGLSTIPNRVMFIFSNLAAVKRDRPSGEAHGWCLAFENHFFESGKLPFDSTNKSLNVLKEAICALLKLTAVPHPFAAVRLRGDLPYCWKVLTAPEKRMTNLDAILDEIDISARGSKILRLSLGMPLKGPAWEDDKTGRSVRGRTWSSHDGGDEPATTIVSALPGVPGRSTAERNMSQQTHVLWTVEHKLPVVYLKLRLSSCR